MTWEKLGSRVVYDNPWITVREDNVMNPRGGQNQYGHVHFKNKAIAIVPLDEDHNTWLVGQDRYTLGTYSWEVPMGGAAENEQPLDAAKRELREETGLSAEKWTKVMRLHLSNSITDEEGFVFLAEELSEGEPEFDETEKLDVRKLPLSEALTMVNSGQITDAMSVAAILKVTAHQQG
jgi:8-oxo-dGTP pyrophosphatase MutT (NUDIX family)